MPRKDGTGPEGKGSRTGRMLGDCEHSGDETLPPLPPRLGSGRGRRGH